jgi:hypothetical protein
MGLVIADDDVSHLSHDPYLRNHVEPWKQQAQLVALGGHCSILEDRPKVVDPENLERNVGIRS